MALFDSLTYVTFRSLIVEVLFNVSQFTTCNICLTFSSGKRVSLRFWFKGMKTEI